MLFIIGLVLSVLFLEWPWHLAVLIPVALVEVLEVLLWLRLHRVPGSTGASSLIGRKGEVVTPCDPNGQVKVAGQIWSATASAPAPIHAAVVVTGVEGIRLRVDPQSR